MFVINANFKNCVHVGVCSGKHYYVIFVYKLKKSYVTRLSMFDFSKQHLIEKLFISNIYHNIKVMGCHRKNCCFSWSFHFLNLGQSLNNRMTRESITKNMHYCLIFHVKSNRKIIENTFRIIDRRYIFVYHITRKILF